MSLFEVDVNALNGMITALQNYRHELESARSPLQSAYNNFNATFSSPDRENFEASITDLFNHLNLTYDKADEIRAGLHNLLVYVQDAENVKF